MKTKIREIILNLFEDTVTQTTNIPDLSPEMKTYYSKYLIDNATPHLVHSQFGQNHPIPKNGGKTIEFRKYSPLKKALKEITEGVTPAGNNLQVTTVTATVKQYGDWIRLSDVLLLTAIDNNLVQATELLGDQAGRTLDTITRDVINAGTNVMYAPAGDVAVTSRAGISESCKLGVQLINKAAAKLKTWLAKPIDGSYVAIIHPFVAYDLMEDPRFIEAHKYAAPENLFNGEIGKIGNVRFVESTEAKIFVADDLTAGARNLTVKTAASSGTSIAIKEAITAADATALAGRKILIGSTIYTLADNQSAGAAGSATLTTTSAVNITANAVIYPAEHGYQGQSVYSTLILGANAYGDISIEGGGLEHIFKPLGSAGSADPLNQRASVAWKALKVAKILVENYMLRIESGSTFNMEAAN